ncbi:hypothetical protein NPIL_201741, partial [Nephila pilipes]
VEVIPQVNRLFFAALSLPAFDPLSAILAVSSSALASLVALVTKQFLHGETCAIDSVLSHSCSGL